MYAFIHVLYMKLTSDHRESYLCNCKISLSILDTLWTASILKCLLKCITFYAFANTMQRITTAFESAENVWSIYFLVNFVRIYLPWWYWLITWNIYVWWFAKSVLKQWTACCDYVAESRWKESSLVTNATYIYHKKSISIF